MTAPAQLVLAELKACGIDLVASLPDKWLSDILDAVEADADVTHVRVTREDDGMGICAGAYLGGRKAALVCQNAGVLLSTNVLAGYAFHHQIPFLVLAAYRGREDDAYYYQIYKGRITVPVLEAIGVPYGILDDPGDFKRIRDYQRQSQLARMPAVLLMTSRALAGRG